MPATIMVVDDEPIIRWSLATRLKEEGHRVIEAETIREAEVAVGTLIPDAVVLDSYLPDGDALVLVNRWRDGNMGRVPVIVVTARHDRQEIAAAVVAGVDVFVPKPCPASVLAAHVDRALQSTKPTRRMSAFVV